MKIEGVAEITATQSPAAMGLVQLTRDNQSLCVKFDSKYAKD